MKPPLGPAPMVAAATRPPSRLVVVAPGGGLIGICFRVHTAVPADTPPAGVMLAGAKAACQPCRRAHPCMVCSLSFVILCSCTISRSMPSRSIPCTALWHPGHEVTFTVANFSCDLRCRPRCRTCPPCSCTRARLVCIGPGLGPASWLGPRRWRRGRRTSFLPWPLCL